MTVQVARRVLMLGRPGSGKGTQTRRLSDALQVGAIDLGFLLRRLGDSDPTVRATLDSGGYVPREISEPLLRNRIATERDGGFILDGYPRFRWQVDLLVEFLAPTTLDAALLLDVRPSVAADRLAGRLECLKCGVPCRPSGRLILVCERCGGGLRRRGDDDRDALLRKIQSWESEMTDVLDAYRASGLLREVDGEGSEEIVLGRLVRALGEPG